MMLSTIRSPGEKLMDRRVRDALGMRLGFLIDVGNDVGTKFGDFGWIFDDFEKKMVGFVQAFGKDLGQKQ